MNRRGIINLIRQHLHRVEVDVLTGEQRRETVVNHIVAVGTERRSPFDFDAAFDFLSLCRTKTGDDCNDADGSGDCQRAENYRRRSPKVF